MGTGKDSSEATDDLDDMPLAERRSLIRLRKAVSPLSRVPEPPKCSIDEPGARVSSETSKEWPGLPRGVKFQPSDTDLLWHLLAKVGKATADPHPFIHEFITCLDDFDRFGHTHPQNLPGIKDGTTTYFFHKSFKTHNTEAEQHDDCGGVCWKKNGSIKPLIIDNKHRGYKSIMTLHAHMNRSENLSWIMHQFQLGSDNDDIGELVVSKIFSRRTSQTNEISEEKTMNIAVAIPSNAELAICSTSHKTEVHQADQHLDVTATDSTSQEILMDDHYMKESEPLQGPNIKCLDGISATNTIDELYHFDQLMMHEYSSMLLANTSSGYVDSNCSIGQSKCDMNCTSGNLLDAVNDGSIPLNDMMSNRESVSRKGFFDTAKLDMSLTHLGVIELSIQAWLELGSNLVRLNVIELSIQAFCIGSLIDGFASASSSLSLSVVFALLPAFHISASRDNDGVSAQLDYVKMEPTEEDHFEITTTQEQMTSNCTQEAAQSKVTEKLKEEPIDDDLFRNMLNNITSVEHDVGISESVSNPNLSEKANFSEQFFPKNQHFERDNTASVVSVRRKRKKTATSSVRQALEEDAPGLLQILLDRDISIEDIKLYETMEDDEALEVSEEDDDFKELETVINKLFSARASMFKFSVARHMKGSKPYYVNCLISLINQAKYLRFSKNSVQWGWCRDLQSFIFIFYLHNRIVLERPEYGYATYFFELVHDLPIDWQIKRLVTAMKLTSCGRTTLIENKPLVIGEDLTEGEARVLEEYGWTSNCGLGSMLNFCDRVVHDARTESNEWWNKIGKMLMAGYESGRIVLDHLPKKAQKYARNKNLPKQEEELIL
ncbi:hypothetical protein ZIOFF_030527 [Zingiber officinale]|uniref:NAC domain-containing protein n=1 Tax=Zingiber officinale TaxID=94328 RepID=A0A8J5GYC0_ZINOF|nr:hypothetical protein ZIOFF_030527 [Zingiber officinale]